MTPRRGQTFAYEAYDLDARRGVLACHYRADDEAFVETITFSAPDTASVAAIDAAARLVHLLAGISYYKATAAPRIDCTRYPLTEAERRLLGAHFRDGLGEFAYVNDLDLSDIEIDARPSERRPVVYGPTAKSPLIPFGGGIDSIVTVEGVRPVGETPRLFVVSRRGDRFDAIEAPAAVTGLPVTRAERQLDPKILRSAELGYLNGHVPVTGILSSLAVLAAVSGGHDAVVMSNERSASVGNTVVAGRSVNHQFSKSLEYENLLGDVVAETFGGSLGYFSWLRPFSELWVAERFADLTGYHRAFRSCNRAFHIDRSIRLDTWCGRCDKCCFIDLVLAPFMGADDLRKVFGGDEPLDNPSLKGQFRTLIDASGSVKPFECVGDTDECRAAAHLAAARPDRAGAPLLAELAAEAEALSAAPMSDLAARLLEPAGTHRIPDAYARPLRLG